MQIPIPGTFFSSFLDILQITERGHILQKALYTFSRLLYDLVFNFILIVVTILLFSFYLSAASIQTQFLEGNISVLFTIVRVCSLEMVVE